MPPPAAEIPSVEAPPSLDDPQLVELESDPEPPSPRDEPALARLLPERHASAFPLEPLARLTAAAPPKMDAQRDPTHPAPVAAQAEPLVSAVIAPSRSARPRIVEPPAYPSLSRRRGEQGEVLLELSLDCGGAVVGVSVVHSSGFRALDRATVDAAWRWLFDPALELGTPVASRLLHRVVFRLKPR
jgi:protein TonB